MNHYEINTIKPYQLKRSTVIAFILTTIIFFITKDFPFFWDNVVQISVPANYYFDNGFIELFLPNDIATGHPTFVGMYFAGIWKLFGRTLLISHLAIAPLVFGLLFQIIALINNLKIKYNWTCFLMLGFVLIDTTFMSQLSLITYEIIQLLFFFYCLNQGIKKNNNLFAIGFALLLLVSLRGALVGFGLIISHLILSDKEERFRVSHYLKFIPGILGLSIFLIVFYYNQGWIIHNTISDNWSGSAQSISINDIFKNILAVGWQITDYGRILIFFILGFILYQWRVKGLNHRLKYLFFIAFGQISIISGLLIFSDISFGHRYFLPAIIPISLLVALWLSEHSTFKYSKHLGVGVLMFLFSGHFWIYPQKMSQGWDSTTLHWQYLNVSEDMHDYIVSKEIPVNKIQTFFPAYKLRRLTHLENVNFGYSKFNELIPSEYILYSNAFNVSDDIIDMLDSESNGLEIIKNFSSLGVYVELYKRTE